MYARVSITVDAKKEALVVPITAMVDLGGRRGVFTPLPDNTAAFRVVQVGVETGDAAEILGGLQEGDRVITTGAAALRDGDRIILPGGGGRGGGRRGNNANGGNAGGTTANAQPGGDVAASSGEQGTQRAGGSAGQFRSGGSPQGGSEQAATSGQATGGNGESRRGGRRGQGGTTGNGQAPGATQ
jgi:hypothetical protein